MTKKKRRAPLKDGSGQGKGRSGGLRRERNTGPCKQGGAGYGQGKGRGQGRGRAS